MLTLAGIESATLLHGLVLPSEMLGSVVRLPHEHANAEATYGLTTGRCLVIPGGGGEERRGPPGRNSFLDPENVSSTFKSRKKQNTYKASP